MRLLKYFKIFFLNFFLTHKTWKNHPKKLLIIGPDPFFPQSSIGHSPQSKIDSPYHEISRPDICSLICDCTVHFYYCITLPIIPTVLKKVYCTVNFYYCTIMAPIWHQSVSCQIHCCSSPVHLNLENDLIQSLQKKLQVVVWSCP